MVKSGVHANPVRQLNLLAAITIAAAVSNRSRIQAFGTDDESLKEESAGVRITFESSCKRSTKLNRTEEYRFELS